MEKWECLVNTVNGKNAIFSNTPYLMGKGQLAVTHRQQEYHSLQ
jgi:hypothetical protein